VLNTLSQFFARPPNPAGHNVGSSAAPMSLELLLLGAYGISRNTFTAWLVQPVILVMCTASCLEHACQRRGHCPCLNGGCSALC
jgi:hypothetical protein